jgi:hypothetical protein
VWGGGGVEMCEGMGGAIKATQAVGVSWVYM